ncbi:hypothetical protein N7486_008839 [Penicillium sp. IBT 16267x]|nr:hypothetical protein N7486_008839 [Penicillium sp. IBT 16267x]
MVFLRLEVRVYPREQVPSGSGFLRSMLPNKRPESEDTNTIKSFAGFLLTLEKPEELSLGNLTYLIKQKWKALRPNSEPLVIKKLLDDAMPLIDLDAGMSVEEVFVNRGKARADGHDQRGIVRVIQKPHAHAPERFPSVELDFEAASEAVTRKRKHQTPENDTTSKEPRIEGQSSRLAPQSPKSPGSTRRQELGPSWTSPHRRPSNVLPPNGKGLGLGITSSPPKRPAYDRERHVSFSDTNTPNAQNPPKPSILPSSQVSAPPSSQFSEIMYPPNFDRELIRQLNVTCENEEREVREIGQMLNNPDTHASLRPILSSMLDLHEKIKNRAPSNGNRRRSAVNIDYGKRLDYRKRLEELRIELQEREDKFAAESLPLPKENGHATPEIEESVEVSDTPDSDDEAMSKVNGNNDSEKSKHQTDDSAVDSDEEMADAESVKVNGQAQAADDKGELTNESESSGDSESTDESEPEADHPVKASMDEEAAIVVDSDDEPELPVYHRPKTSVGYETRTVGDDDDDDEEADEEEEDEEEAEEEAEEEEGSDQKSSDSPEDDNEFEPEQESGLEDKNRAATIKDKDEIGKIEHTKGTGTVEVKATTEPTKLPERNKVQEPVQDSSSADSESEDELDSKFGRSSIPGPSPASAKPIQQPPMPEKTTPRVTPRRTLKGLLKDQKDQQARRAQQPPIQQHKAIKSAPTPKKSSIYSVSDSESESSNNDGPGGDILANGQSGKLRQPWSR